ncbi:UPF0361 protein C3orf37 homolog [Trichuris trichiura]|uniref:Abasic site processing protein HMCES n=1 Tax=Trichuris trichiura TaxID=36087 RepID=A0A077Z3Q0_TRITR|nr:UPF0361 protein C3orf37 homolog [Trichuris trichiura]
MVSSDVYGRDRMTKSGSHMSVLLVQMEWGLELSWGGSQHDRQIINARAESVLSKPLFKESMRRGRRCAILTQGFYEWRKSTSGKQPYFIYMPDDDEDSKSACSVECDSKLMPLAGLYFPKKDKSPAYTSVIITVDSSPGIEFIHDRMPAILDTDEAVLNWLDCGQFQSDEVVKYLRPYASLRYHAVSTRVNHSAYDDAENIQPIDDSKLSGEKRKSQPPLESFFSPKKEKLK